MGFETRDSVALSSAEAKGFHISYRSTEEPDHPWEFWLAHVACPATPNTDAPAEDLRAIIDAANRLRPRTTVWLDVHPEAKLADYVIPAIRQLSGYGAFILVTHGTASTHPPGDPLDEFTMEAVENANASSMMWHPNLGELIWASPRQARADRG